LFVPMAEAVCFAMIAAYILSRTLVPTLVMLMLKHPAREFPLYRRFNAAFERMREGYNELLCAMLHKRRAFSTAFLLFCVLSCGIYPFLGRDFFPSVDAG